jgi:hypothetical protein
MKRKTTKRSKRKRKINYLERGHNNENLIVKYFEGFLSILLLGGCLRQHRTWI